MQLHQKPLSGVKILDFTALVPGPLAGLMLAEAGAEVIKIEPLGGEAMRQPPPSWGDLRALFALINRGKRSLALDLKDAATLAALEPLLASADVLLEGFRPGVMARLGLDYAAVSTVNPRIIYCAITGYGQKGPKAHRAGHDLSYVAETGLLALSSGAPGHLTLPPVLIADVMGGSYPAVTAIVMALFRRERTGEGAFLDIAMTEGTFLPMFWAWAQGHAGDGWPAAGEHIFTGASARYQLYAAADGGLVAVAVLEDKFWQAFCDAIGLPGDLRGATEAGSVIAAVTERIGARPLAHWREIFARTDCCVAVVEGLNAALRDPHFAPLAVRGTVSLEIGRSIPALPMPFASLLDADQETRGAPELGEANREYGFSAPAG